MAYDEGLAQRIRERLEGAEGLSEKKMMGGVEEDAELTRWVQRGQEFASSQEPK